jgi:hypothetical protein
VRFVVELSQNKQAQSSKAQHKKLLSRGQFCAVEKSRVQCATPHIVECLTPENYFSLKFYDF